MTPINEEQQYTLAFAIAEQLAGVSMTQALYILTTLTPALITDAHTVHSETMAAAKVQVFSQVTALASEQPDQPSCLLQSLGQGLRLGLHDNEDTDTTLR